MRLVLLACACLVAACTGLGAYVPGLSDDDFQPIQAGMTRDEVLRRLGPPVDSMVFPRQREVSWEYRFMDTWGYRSLFYVNFDERGIVVSKLTRRLENDRFPFR